MTSSPNDTEKQLAAQLQEISAAAALDVAPYLREVARTLPPHDTKRDMHDPVTVHDRKVEQLLHTYLGEAVPGSRILGEEMGEQVLSPEAPVPSGASEHPRAGELGARVRWIVDPIDGTANFAAGSTYFGTSIAAELDGKVVAGSVTIPWTGELFTADLSEAWHVNAAGERTVLDASGPAAEDTALIVSYYPSMARLASHPELSLRHMQDLGAAYMAFRRTGASAIDLALVAAGWLGAFLATNLGPWDAAAGVHMINVAGGKVINLNSPIHPDQPEGLRPIVLASVATMEPGLAEQVLQEFMADIEG